jgi:DNA-binding MarR family transcriptional regulator
MYALNESLAFLLNRAGAAVAGAFTLELKEQGLTLPMWRVLAALWGAGGQTLSGLADLTSVEISTLSRQIAALHKEGLISREQSSVNWRSINIGLTTKGRSLVEQLLPAVARHETAALEGVSAADVRRLKLLLNRVYANLVRFDHVELLDSPEPK